MSVKDKLFELTTQSAIGLIIIVAGFYALIFDKASADVKIAVVGLMGAVIGYYFGDSRAASKRDGVK